jgi:hypothetical protein
MTLVITPHIRQPAATTCILSALSPIRPLKGETAACAGDRYRVDLMLRMHISVSTSKCNTRMETCSC